MTSARESVITTPRLELHHLTIEKMVSLFERPEDAAIFEGRGYANPYRVLVDDNKPLPWRVRQVAEDPASNKWFVRLIVLKEIRSVIGSTSFHAPPDHDGVLEIGIGLHERFHGRGFGTEAVKGMWQWAVAQPGVRTLRYSVSPANQASVNLVRKFGFVRVGQQIDEEDGPEDLYEMPAEQFRQSHSVTAGPAGPGDTRTGPGAGLDAGGRDRARAPRPWIP